MWRDENIHRAEHHLLWPDRNTGPIWMFSSPAVERGKRRSTRSVIPRARDRGIDVSPTSLEHTERLKQNYNLTNLETQQLAIENVAELDQSFDLIICTGVLHHLADPDAGLRALRSC